jgi:hypothetical protein
VFHVFSSKTILPTGSINEAMTLSFDRQLIDWQEYIYILSTNVCRPNGFRRKDAET